MKAMVRLPNVRIVTLNVVQVLHLTLDDQSALRGVGGVTVKRGISSGADALTVRSWFTVFDFTQQLQSWMILSDL